MKAGAQGNRILPHPAKAPVLMRIQMRLPRQLSGSHLHKPDFRRMDIYEPTLLN